MVPDGWTTKSFAEIANAPISYGVVQTGAPVDDGIPCVRVVDIARRDLTPSEMITTSQKISNSYSRTVLKKDDILIALRGVIGQAAIADSLLEGCNLTRGVARFSPNRKLFCPQFLYQVINTPSFSHYIKRQANGSALQEISIKTLRAAKVCLPTRIAEQEKLAELVSIWDRAIESTKKLIENSERQKKALMQQLLTGKKRLKGFSGEWCNAKLGDIVDISKGKAISTKNIKSGNYPVIAGGKTSPYSHANFTHQKAITISASGAYAGYVAYHPDKFWASDCSVVEGTKQVDTVYVFYLLKLAQRKIYSLQSGGAQPHIYPKDLASISFAIPKNEEQRAITHILENSAKGVAELKRKLVLLQREKTALVQQLLTGKRRVKLDQEIAG